MCMNKVWKHHLRSETLQTASTWNDSNQCTRPKIDASRPSLRDSWREETTKGPTRTSQKRRPWPGSSVLYWTFHRAKLQPSLGEIHHWTSSISFRATTTFHPPQILKVICVTFCQSLPLQNSGATSLHFFYFLSRRKEKLLEGKREVPSLSIRMCDKPGRLPSGDTSASLSSFHMALTSQSVSTRPSASHSIKNITSSDSFL